MHSFGQKKKEIKLMPKMEVVLRKRVYMDN